MRSTYAIDRANNLGAHYDGLVSPEVLKPAELITPEPEQLGESKDTTAETQVGNPWEHRTENSSVT